MCIKDKLVKVVNFFVKILKNITFVTEFNLIAHKNYKLFIGN